MKTRAFFIAVVVFLSVSAFTVRAQHDEAPGQAKGKMAMMGQMENHMAEMMGGHRQVADLVEKLAGSFAAMQGEKDPAALAKKTAEHGAFLRELQAKIQAHGAMMQKMETDEAKGTPAAPAEHKH